MIKLRLANVNGGGLATAKDIHVSVDGVEVTKRCRSACIARGPVQGQADCFKLNADGKLYINPLKPNEAAHETLRGNVKIWFDGDENKYKKLIKFERKRGNVIEDVV